MLDGITIEDLRERVVTCGGNSLVLAHHVELEEPGNDLVAERYVEPEELGNHLLAEHCVELKESGNNLLELSRRIWATSCSPNIVLSCWSRETTW